MELMVVVILISVLAMLAVPSLMHARGDRLTFNYARQTSELVHQARARAVGTGAAHLFLFTSGGSSFGGTNGVALLFEALDGTAAPAGPNPLSSCRSADFTWAAGYTPGISPDTTGHSLVVDGVNVNGSTNAVQTEEGIQMHGYSVDDAGAKTEFAAIAMCISPNGSTYVGTGTTPASALVALSSAQPFTGIIEIDVARHGTSGIVGLNRRIIVAGGGQPRIKSE